MANDTPGPDAQPGERGPDRDTETTFQPRTDQPASGATGPYPRPAASWPPAPEVSGSGPGGSVHRPSADNTAGYAPAHGGGGAPGGSGYGTGGGYGTGAYAAGYGAPQGPAGQPGATGQYPGPRYPYPPQPAAGSAGRRRRRGPLVAFGLVTALLGGGVGGVVGASIADESGGSTGVLADPLPETDASTTPLGPVEAVAERVLPSVVRLLVEGRGRAGEGSGMVLSSDGLMLTNNHVVEAAAGGGTIVAVFQDGRTARADVVGLDPSSDLAVIRAQGVSGLTAIEFGDSDAVRVGEQVVAFGSPLGLGGTVTTGIISAVDRAVSVGEESGASEATVLSALQTDAAINPGNSGGPLTDLQGRVVGINSVIATTGAEGGSIGVGFAIPINQARRTAQELEATGRATRAILGAGVNVGGAAELTGAVLGSIVPGGPAEQAGLRPGQTVTRVGDRLVSNGNDLIAAIRENAPGDRVTLVVDGRPVDVVLSGESS